MKAFLFDLDGTLIDRNSGAQGWVREKFQPILPSYRWNTFISRFYELDSECRCNKPKLFSTLVSEFDLPISGPELVNEYRENVWRYCELYPDVELTLKALRTSNFRLAIVSNGTSICQGAKISGLRLDELVDISLISETEGLRKPNPQLFLRAAQQMKVPSEQCFVVGDSEVDDIVGGNSAGMRTIWIEQEGGWPVALPVRPDFTIASVADIPDLLKRL